MKTYTAVRGLTGRRVVVNDVVGSVVHKYDLDPRPSQKIINHSPDGFEWGYSGSGPAQLALAILLDLHPNTPDVAQHLYQDFKAAFVAPADSTGFVIREDDVRVWVTARLQEDRDIEDRLRAKTS